MRGIPWLPRHRKVGSRCAVGMMPSARLGAMSGIPKAPAAPRLRAIREAWLRSVIGQLEADPGISAAGFVGSIGRGDADDWSDVDLVIVVPDDQVGRYADGVPVASRP